MDAKLAELKIIASDLQQRTTTERKTVGQWTVPEFRTIKFSYLSASKFGLVCRRRDSTPAHGTIMIVMYPADLADN
jgi:hypothetical protein